MNRVILLMIGETRRRLRVRHVHRTSSRYWREYWATFRRLEQAAREVAMERHRRRAA